MHNGTSDYSSRDEDHCNRYQLSPIGEHSNKHFPANYHGFLFTVIIVNSPSFPPSGSKASGIVKTTRSEKTNESDKLEHNSYNNDNNSIR